MKEIAVTHGRRIIAIKAAPADPRDTLRRFGPDFEAKNIGGQQVGAIVAKGRDFIDGDPPPPGVIAFLKRRGLHVWLGC